MANKKVNFKHFHMPYNPTIAAVVNEIGNAVTAQIQSLSSAFPLPLPAHLVMPNLRISWQGSGDYNVSVLLEIALLKTAWNISTIESTRLKGYVKFYMDNRSNADNEKASGKDTALAGMRYVEVSQEADDAARTISEYIDANVKKLSYVNKKDSARGKAGESVPNYKAVAIIALCYARDLIAEKAT